MADWFSIPDTAVDPDAPLTSQLAYAWRDNCIAIAEGASGAPRIQPAALGSWYTSLGDTKTLAFLGRSADATISEFIAGNTYSGSLLKYAGVTINGSGSGITLSATSPSGTWRAVGQAVSPGGASPVIATLFIRVS